MSCSLQEKLFLMETDLTVKYFLQMALLCFKPLCILDAFRNFLESWSLGRKLNFWDISTGSKFDPNESFIGNFINCALAITNKEMILYYSENFHSSRVYSSKDISTQRKVIMNTPSLHAAVIHEGFLVFNEMRIADMIIENHSILIEKL